jgi:hypothetical protein
MLIILETILLGAFDSEGGDYLDNEGSSIGRWIFRSSSNSGRRIFHGSSRSSSSGRRIFCGRSSRRRRRLSCSESVL